MNMVRPIVANETEAPTPAPWDTIENTLDWAGVTAAPSCWSEGERATRPPASAATPPPTKNNAFFPPPCFRTGRSLDTAVAPTGLKPSGTGGTSGAPGGTCTTTLAAASISDKPPPAHADSLPT